MSPKRSYYAMCAIVTLLLVAIAGGAYQGHAMLKAESTKLVGLKAKVDALSRQQVALQKAKKDVAASKDLYKIAKVIVPENKDQAQAVRQIVKLADDNKVVIDSINFPASSLGSGVAAGKVPSAASTGPSATTGANPTLSQLTPVLKIPGVYSLQLTVSSSTSTLATYSQLISFLSALENNRQTALVSSISITPDATLHNKFSFSLVLDIYIKP